MLLHTGPLLVPPLNTAEHDSGPVPHFGYRATVVCLRRVTNATVAPNT
ncbi:hypothetical protein [Nocardia fluminea]